MKTMIDYADEICLLCACALAGLLFPDEPLMITGLLIGVIAVCSESMSRTLLRIAMQTTFAVLACISFPFLCFLPLDAYAMMHERNWGVRLIWVVPICVQGAMGVSWQGLAWVTVLCVGASFLAAKDMRAESERAGLQRAYDLLREQTFATDEESQAASQGYPEAQPERYEPAFFEGLTERELAVVHLVAEGMDNREISQQLFLSEGTVRNHISSILSKKDLRNRTQIAIMYYRG